MSLLEYTVEEHVKWVAKENREDGRAEGKAESILDVLSEFGNISSDLSAKIMSEKNLDVLKRWLKLAAKVDGIEEFEQQMQMD